MIETLTALSALMLAVQSWMPLLEIGRSWDIWVKYTITDAQLLQYKPACCRYLTRESGQILRVDGHIWVIKGD